MVRNVVKIIPGAFSIVLTIYGFFYVLTEVFVSFIPFGIFLTTIIVFAVEILKLPPPPQELVEAIIGKELSDDDEVSSGYHLKTVAHRGAGMDAPENSLIAFKMCHEKGCDAIEFDVTLTSDGVPIVFHDTTLERMTDLNLVISQTKWENLSNIDISVKHPYKERFVNTNIPTLYQTVTQLLADGQKMIIDVKDNNTKMVSVILALFETHPELHSQAIVSSFFPNLIYLIRRGNPKIVCSLATRPNHLAYEWYRYPTGPGDKRYQSWHRHYLAILCDMLSQWALPSFTYYLLGISVLLLHKDALSAKSIIDWRMKGIRVIPWTVNSPIEKQHMARNLKIPYLTDTLTGECSAYSTFS